MTAQPKHADAPSPLTGLLREAYSRLSELPDERQGEIAQMLLDIVEGERSPLRLTPEQQAEVDAAMSEDGPYASDEEMEAFFKRYRT